MGNCLTNFDNALQTSFVFKLFKSPHLTYSVQNVTFPSIGVGRVDVPYKEIKYNLPSNVIDYSSLSISFIVDENFENYNYIYKQMMNYQKSKENGNISDVLDILHVFRLNSNNKPIADIVFNGAYCSNLGSISYGLNVSDADVLICDATFEYQTFEIKPIVP